MSRVDVKIARLLSRYKSINWNKPHNEVIVHIHSHLDLPIP